jgi:2-keto-3-deoxy-L-rhamnonate aldolase RhmA
LRVGEPVLGTFVKSPDASVAEIVARSGFDFLIADLEHSSLTLQDVEGIVRAGALCSVPVVARIPVDALHQAGRALDAGAVGLQLTGLVNRATAEHARRACSYPPAGTRSMSLSQRSALFGGMGASEHLTTSKCELVIIGQIESAATVAALPELLLETSAVDVWFLGSLDLSVSLGHPGSLDHPEVVEKLREAAHAVLRAGARLGAFAQNLGEALSWLDRGATMVAVSSDYALLAAQARDLVGAWRAREAPYKVPSPARKGR